MVSGRRILATLSCVAWLSVVTGSSAQTIVDRPVVRFQLSETESSQSAFVIFQRELAFEARLEALTAGAGPTDPVSDRHIRSALERHVAETLLSTLPVDPLPRPDLIAKRAALARAILETRIGGPARLVDAAKIEGISLDEIDAMFRRTARAAIYIERVIAPNLEPTETELREIHASKTTPFSDQPYVLAREPLRKWVIGQRVDEAVQRFFERTRTRVRMTHWKHRGSTRTRT